ncbi:uncharacterized membrane protein YheB (UPF0754 family) [Scopulibacillus daqui]|uniref:Uncharacterized membrane protein YheB (UPF0754 family) n=1 Tax=Scopulibacillus daqui TaxID=1469162 RepID=A0ABS2Q5Y0_9BACL|nr:DUF445 family protein [Scopulibacillus daqui]MBM7646912.1 uncharacterized membrane protein YheB (UPF0754 family) [Scopulibacillus daqui]
MLDILIHFIILIVVGALIGGLTNYIAIKMLFRPHKPIYIGKFRLPFTPGLIPKRQEEIAVQLGQLVMKHLITAESIERKLSDPRFSKTMISQVQKQADGWFGTKRPFREILGEIDGAQWSSQLETKTAAWLTNRLSMQFNKIKTEPLQKVIPEKALARVEDSVSGAASFLTERLAAYLESDEGKAKCQYELNRFFEKKGLLGNMLGMLFNSQMIVNRIYPELIHFIKQASFEEMLNQLLQKEWDRLKNQPLESLLNRTGISEQDILHWLSSQIQSHLPYRQWLEQSPSDLPAEWREAVINRMIPNMVHTGLRFASHRVSEMLKSLEIEQLVSDQVRGFSLYELEQVVLIISKREFNMITYLGALLGGFIGLIQGLLLLVI